MYMQHFGMTALPFTITPDTSYFFACASHQQALNTLLIAVRSGEGFIKVTGEVGTGKTLLCRKFLSALDQEDIVTAYIPNPYVGPMTLLLGVADELGIHYPDKLNQHQLLKLLTQFLLQASAEGSQVVLCLDEAQALPIETLEALRLLSNLETERSKLLQVVLFGQPELNAKLNTPSIRQLKQRISFTATLRPLNLGDVEYYLAHRLSIAGYHGSRLFSEAAIKALHRYSGGVPRLINILAHKALLATYGEGAAFVDRGNVKSAAHDTESVPKRNRLVKIVTAAVAVLLVSASAVVWSHSWL